MGPRATIDDIERHAAVGQRAVDRAAHVDAPATARLPPVAQLCGEPAGEWADRRADVVEFARRGAGQLDVEGISGTSGLDRSMRRVGGRVVEPGADLVRDHRPQRFDPRVEFRPVDRLAVAAGASDRGRQDCREVDGPEHSVEVIPLGARAVVESGEPVDDPLDEQLPIGVGIEHTPFEPVPVRAVLVLSVGEPRSRPVELTRRQAHGEVSVEQFGEHRLVMRVLDERGAEHRAQLDALRQVDVLDGAGRIEHLGERDVRAAPPEVGDEAFDLRPDRVLRTRHT